MKFKKKLFYAIIYVIVLTIIINILYGFFFGDDLKTLNNYIEFKFSYFNRTTLTTKLNYNDFIQGKEENNDVISINNISIKLSNINYEKNIGKLSLKFDFYTNDNQILDTNIGCVAKIYENKNTFYNGLLGISSSKYLNYLLDLDEDIEYEKFEFEDSNEENVKSIELDLKLMNNYEISNNLNIEFWDLTYKTVDEYLYHSAVEPLGVFKFIIDF